MKNEVERSEIGAVIRMSVPYTVKGGKTVYATVESSTFFSSEENTPESRKKARAEAREELTEELNTMVEEVLNPIQQDLAAG